MSTKETHLDLEGQPAPVEPSPVYLLLVLLPAPIPSLLLMEVTAMEPVTTAFESLFKTPPAMVLEASIAVGVGAAVANMASKGRRDMHCNTEGDMFQSSSWGKLFVKMILKLASSSSFIM